MTDRFSHLPFVFVVSAVAVVGCASDSNHGTIHGTVTLDGNPLPNGLIRFDPLDGQSSSADAIITDGKFTARIPVGEKRVFISAPKVVGKRKMYDTPDSPTVDVVEELLPDRYNSRTELTMTVTAGSQDTEYALTSEE